MGACRYNCFIKQIMRSCYFMYLHSKLQILNYSQLKMVHQNLPTQNDLILLLVTVVLALLQFFKPYLLARGYSY